MPFNNSVFEASKLVSTKTLLLKQYYRRQGIWTNGNDCSWDGLSTARPPLLASYRRILS